MKYDFKIKNTLLTYKVFSWPLLLKCQEDHVFFYGQINCIFLQNAFHINYSCMASPLYEFACVVSGETLIVMPNRIPINQGEFVLILHTCRVHQKIFFKNLKVRSTPCSFSFVSFDQKKFKNRKIIFFPT